MTSRLSLPLLSALFLGCAATTTPSSPPRQPDPPSPALAPVATATTTPAPSPEPTAPTAPATPTDTPKPEAPPPTACVITQDGWTPERARVLRTPSGLVFATMTHADVISLATRDGATLEARVYGLLLHSPARAGDLPLFIRTDDLVFAGVLRAGRATGLRWTPADGPQMRVAPPRDPRVRFVSSPTVEVACADLALVPGDTGTARPEHTLRGPGPIAVAASPGGPAVVQLRPGHTGDVTLLDRDGRHVKIAWLIADKALADATVIGWVDGARLGDPSPPSGGSIFSGHLSGLKGTSDWGGCQAEHPLLADAGRGPETVGTILVGTRVRRGPRRGALVEVEVEGPSVQEVPPVLQLRAGARFLLAPADANECAS